MKARILTNDEIKILLERWRYNNDKDALSELVICNMRLVYAIAKKYVVEYPLIDADDLHSNGKLGLIRAINKISMSENIEYFYPYVSCAIKNSMNEVVRSYNKHKHVMSFNEPMYQSKDGDEINLEDLLGCDVDELINQVISKIKIDIVREALQCLSSKERQIILLRYGMAEEERLTQQEIANILGYSKNWVFRHEQKALIKMRHPRNTLKLKDYIE